jgi:putative cardiolipin synthase
MKQLLPTLGLVLASCASVNYDYPREASTFIPVADNAELDRKIEPLVAGRREGVSGFYALVDGIDAAAARLRLTEQAQRSIDLQYYLIKRDQVGQVFLYSLLSAADRGVRVRLLLDDMFNKGFDHDMMALNAHPKFEIRVFNPFNRGLLGRSVGAAFNFRRINRRMHNKSFTVDNRVTIIGGRNIADEYFGVREDSAFGDLDVIGIGPIVQDVADMFDTYWQHETAVPLAGFIKPLKDPQKALDEYRKRLAAANEELAGTRYAEAVIDRAYKGVEDEIADIRWSPYTLVFDTPDKGIKNKADESEMIISPLIQSLSTVEQELMIISPYFVPRKELTRGLIEARNSGIEVSVITNSLAANNQATVHGGYAPSRKPLLKVGVKLYEVRPDAHVSGTEYVDASSARATLHTKSYVLDRREVFIGSFNFDPRSAYINTEMGVLIDDPELGADFMNGLEKALPGAVWEVSLTDNNKLEWTGLEGDEPITYRKEPMTSWWQRFKAGFYRILPIRSQL